MSAERAEQLFGSEWEVVIENSTTAIKDRFAERMLIYRNRLSLLRYFYKLLTLQRLKHFGFLYTFTSKDTLVSIRDSIRLVSKPISILYCYTT